MFYKFFARQSVLVSSVARTLLVRVRYYRVSNDTIVIKAMQYAKHNDDRPHACQPADQQLLARCVRMREGRLVIHRKRDKCLIMY